MSSPTPDQLPMLFAEPEPDGPADDLEAELAEMRAALYAHRNWSQNL